MAGRPKRARKWPLKSGFGGSAVNPRSAHHGCHRIGLSGPSSTTRIPSGSKDARCIRDHRAIAIEPVSAAVEREPRIVVANFRLQPRDLAARDIGRVGNDEIERRRARPRQNRRRQNARAIRKPRRAALSRAIASAPALISVPTPVAFGNSSKSASRSAPVPVPKSAMRSATRAVGDRRERCLDDGFGVRARHQRRRRDAQIAGPRIPCGRGCAPPAHAPAGACASAANGRRLRSSGQHARSPASQRARDRARAHARPGGAHRARENSKPACAKRLRAARAAPRRSTCPARDRECSSRCLVLRRQQGRLMLGHQRLDDFVERFAFDDLRQLVERQIDAVIGDAALRKIIGADALGAVARADLALALGGARGIELACARGRRVWRAASPSPWPCSCAASAPPARRRRCRSADG